ncbi:transcription termination/antitermination NusG family protein [Shinella sp.]|uniref:transcription termination/antitermination NusG family protein n=1 Tax=Shinella sp. TaxID=1870904 RepID=UPI0029B3013A|nr:transcription termination/antitermination NusG family protein [Shinella sp.]MDX3973276.1 hypothetical protein [Shinella sp.]
MTSKERWYAIRTKPGTQRMAKPLLIAANATEKEKESAERRKGESIIERQLRQKGIDVYMPASWLRLKHHRTNKMIERRIPFLVGYAFVHLPDLEFEKVREVEGVVCMLSSSRFSGPVRFPESLISKLMLAEFDEAQAEQHAGWQEMENLRFKRSEQLRGQLKKILPKGRVRTVPLRDWADVVIGRMSTGAQSQVRALIDRLDKLQAAETLAEIEEVA